MIEGVSKGQAIKILFIFLKTIELQYHDKIVHVHNTETLKWQRPIGEGDQELEKRLVQEELI
jgi:hypothetical protein